ncbi:MAG TPA: SMC-Scp complex subunit ScpB [Povalibacter sp.]|nr:SMC-Scp complex subunit ScpB [Povalibacter sp.]
MNEQDLKHIIEATLLAAGRPVTTQQLLELFEERDRPTPEQLQTAIELLAADYESRGIELLQVASGWRIQVRARAMDVVSRLWQERPSRYSRALLETLALVAYRQPITRSEIEEIRGVAISSTIMRTLQERNWIRVVGHREVPGRPELLGTTREFLDYFGLKSLDQLPTLAELRDVETIGVQLELPGGEATAEGEAAAGNTLAEAVENFEGRDPVAAAEDEAAADAEAVAHAEAGLQAASDESEPEPEDEDEEADEDQELSADAEEVELSADDSELSADAEAESDDPELSADAEEAELSADGGEEGDEFLDEEAEAPTLVASPEGEQDDSRPVGEPPREG